MRSDRGPFLMETTYLWEDDEQGGTWMTLRSRGEPTAFAGLAAPILATAVRRATASDLAQLKSILEGVNVVLDRRVLLGSLGGPGDNRNPHWIFHVAGAG